MNKEKIKLNMIGGGFQHDVCSVALNTNKYIEWDKNKHESNVSIHIDSAIINIPINPSKINFGWIAEASVIIPDTLNAIMNNFKVYKKRFKFIFTYDPRLLKLDPDFFKYVQPPGLSWIQNKKIYRKKKLISFIGSNKMMCQGHGYRQVMINKYKNLVDHYGRGFVGRELPFTIKIAGSVESGKIIGLKDYMYSIAMENAVYDYYYTEKIADCFATGTIPIYWGSRTIERHFDINGIIFLEDVKNIKDLNINLYEKKLKHVENNLEILKKMNTPEDFLYLNYLKGII
tara:strand:- start:312 stop:1172 length:861 start_codon:yes stop_codon:yes gene_type:complete